MVSPRPERPGVAVQWSNCYEGQIPVSHEDWGQRMCSPLQLKNDGFIHIQRNTSMRPVTHDLPEKNGA